MSERSSSASVIAIDLGSNSFHLLEAELDQRFRLQPLEARARKVQLGLDMVDGQLTQAAIDRGLDCLRDFAAFVHSRHTAQVRVVGTQALRQAVNREKFIAPAEEILGRPIDVISGEEEANLSYAGVMNSLVVNDQQVLVVDIGGGSTELAHGNGHYVIRSASAPVGCVTLLNCFENGEINEQNFEHAMRLARESFQSQSNIFLQQWQLVIGCSGTLLAVEQVLIQQGWSNTGITITGLYQLKGALLEFANIEAVSFQGLEEGRRNIFASGAAIVLAFFECFELTSMQLSKAALREGVAWRLLQDNG